MKRLASCVLLALAAVAPAMAQRGAPERPMMALLPGGSVADVLSRRALVLTDTLGLDDRQQSRLRTLFADQLDTLAARSARAPRPRDDRRAPGARPQRRPEEGLGGFPNRRGDRPAFRPDQLDALREPLFATLDVPVRALLTPEQAARYDAFRLRERARADALRAEREARRSGTRPTPPPGADQAPR